MFWDNSDGDVQEKGLGVYISSMFLESLLGGGIQNARNLKKPLFQLTSKGLGWNAALRTLPIEHGLNLRVEIQNQVLGWLWAASPFNNYRLLRRIPGTLEPTDYIEGSCCF